MQTKVKRILSLFMILILVGLTIIESETDSYAADMELFSLEFYFGEDNLLFTEADLSGIKVDVYASVLTNYYEDSDTSEFSHSYAFSVYSDKKGYVSFKKPSEEFLIMVDESSLPINTGVEIQTKFYRGGSVKDRIEITEIDHVDVKLDETSEFEISVNAFNKAGKRINAYYTVSEDKSFEAVKSLLSKNDSSIKGVVYIGDKAIPYEFFISYSFEQRLDFIAEGLYNGNITKSEALQAYIDIYNEHGDDPEIYAGVSLLKNDQNFYNSLSEARQRTINEILDEPPYNRTYTSGRFEIRYTSDSSTIPLFIRSIMDALQAADSSLCSGLSLSQPRSNSTGTPKYYLYVLSSSTGTGGCYCETNIFVGRISSIRIYGITNLDNSSTAFQNGIVSHEYMHAIVHDYRNNNDLPKWFKESWSEWAITRVNGLDGYTCPATNVNAYLSSSYKSFVSDNNVYGKLLYPLFIQQNYGGDTTIADVVENLIFTSNVYTAINNALSGSNTFDYIFPKFMRFVYKPKSLFSSYLDNWNDTAYLSADYGINNYPNNASGGSLNPYAAHYREFAVPTTTPYHLDITVNLSSNYSTFYGKLLMSYSGGVTDWNFTSSGSLVTYSTNIGVTYSKGCVMFVSTNSPSTTSYTITIARS